MTLLSISKEVARNCGLEAPTAVVSGVGDGPIIGQFANEAAQEAVRRVDWGVLRKTTTLTGTGNSEAYTLPTDFDRLIPGMAVKINGTAIRGGISADEWAALTPVVGTPRFYRLLGNKMWFYPYPAAAASITVTYQSRNWCSNDGAEFTADSQTALIPENLIIKGAVWRFKRHIGADFQDYLGEFEAALSDYARFDGGARMP